MSKGAYSQKISLLGGYNPSVSRVGQSCSTCRYRTYFTTRRRSCSPNLPLPDEQLQRVQVVSQRYMNAPTVMTPNCGLESWGKGAATTPSPRRFWTDFCTARRRTHLGGDSCHLRDHNARAANYAETTGI
jgi:hypothetical protein